MQSCSLRRWVYTVYRFRLFPLGQKVEYRVIMVVVHRGKRNYGFSFYLALDFRVYLFPFLNVAYFQFQFPLIRKS